MLSRMFIAALWSPADKGLASWLLFVMFNCDFVTFPCGILGQVWYLIVSIPDLCRLSNFVENVQNMKPVRNCTGFILCIFLADVFIELNTKFSPPTHESNVQITSALVYFAVIYNSPLLRWLLLYSIITFCMWYAHSFVFIKFSYMIQLTINMLLQDEWKTFLEAS